METVTQENEKQSPEQLKSMKKRFGRISMDWFDSPSRIR